MPAPPIADDSPPMASAPIVGPTAGRRPGVFENSALNLGGLVAASGLGALSGLLTARTLGEEAVGVLAVVFGLIEFGRGLTNFTHTPSILEVHRGRAEGAVYGTSLYLKLIGAFVFVLLAALAAPRLAEVFAVPAAAIVLTSTLLIVGSYQEIGTARYEAANEMLKRNVLVTIGPLVGLAAVVVFVLMGRYDVYTAIVTSIIGTLAMSIAFWYHWKRPKFRWDAPTARYLMDYGGRLVLSSFLTQVLLWTDTLLISALRGNADAGVYNVVFQLTFVMVTASIGIGVALLPAMSELAARNADTRLAYQRGTLLALGLSAAMASVYVVLGRPILGLYGPAFVNGYLPLLVLTVFGMAAALAVPAQSMLTVHGRATQLMLLSLAQALLNVPLNFLLITRYGILGASVATTSVFLIGLVLTWWLVWRTTGATPLSHEAFGDAWREARKRLG
jgi:O-antigen/teichoic acid export membrane protein